ncbi:MAG: MBL fold metallo-hydrolase [Rhizobiales bacterium]|nr:MBL fold metallo-hydrolase [Hyphomicrobiales bacterium]
MTDETTPEPPRFDLSFDAEPRRLVEVSPLVRRMLQPNSGPFTFRGTNTYVVGRGDVAVIDPGPDDSGNLAALLAALAGERVRHIVVTHTHRDHSPLAAALRQATGAPIVGCAPHRAARALAEGEIARLDAANDLDYAPDAALADGEALRGDGFTLVAVATPGHTMNHLAFRLPEENALFSGDHVMAWSTSIVAPPDGSMSAYMASLDALRRRDEALYWPGHGGPVADPQRYVRALLGHRRQREAGVLARLAERAMTIPQIVELNYSGLDPRLKGAAALSTFAHVEDLVARGLVACDGALTLEATYRRA